MVVNKYAKYKQPTPAPEQEQEPAPQNKYRKYLQPVPTPAAPATPSLRSETDAIIEEAAAAIPGGYEAFNRKPADPKRMAAMGYVPDPLAVSGYAKPRAPEAPMADTGRQNSLITDIARGLEAPIAGLTGGGLEGWAKTTQEDPLLGATQAVEFLSPVDEMGRAYQGVKQAGAGLMEGDMAKASEGAQQASIQGSYAAMQMLPGSMTLKGVTGRAAPTTLAGAERAAAQSTRALERPKTPAAAKPEPVLTPPSEAPKPYSAPPEPVGRGVVRRNLDRIIGGGVGATLGGTGEAAAAPGDGDSGGFPGGAATGAAIGIFGPRAIAAAGSRGFRAAARMTQAPGSRSAFDERVAARAVRKGLVSAGVNTEQDALNLARAKFGDKPASVADLTQEGVNLTTGISRLPGATGEAARARAEDVLQSRAGRLERDIGGATGASPATIAGDVDRMVELAREQATPAYEALRAQNPQGSFASPRLEQLRDLDILAPHVRAVDRVRDTLAATEGRVIGDFEYWDLIKRSLDDAEQAAIARNQAVPYDLDSVRQAIVQEVDALVPDYAAARQLGGEAPKMNAAFRQGQGLLGGRYTAEDVSRIAESVTGQPLTALQAGVIRSMVGKTEGSGGAVASLTSAGARRKLERVFGKGPADEMQARFAADAAIVQNASRMNPNVGSATPQALLGGGGGVQQAAELAQAVGKFGASPFQTALAAISKSGSYTKAQRDLMGQMLLEGATPENLARIFAGKKPKGTPPTSAGPTTGLGGPVERSGISGNSTALGAAGGTALGMATAPDQNGDGVVDGQERLLGGAGGAISGGLGGAVLGKALTKGAKPPKAPPAKPSFDQRFMKEAQRLVSYNGGVDQALKAQQYVIDQLKNSKAPNAQDRLNRAVSVQYAIRRMAERSNRELDEIVPMAEAAPTGPKPIDPNTNYNIDPRGDKFVIRTDAGVEVQGAPEFTDRKQALAWLQGETRKARQGSAATRN